MGRLVSAGTNNMQCNFPAISTCCKSASGARGGHNGCYDATHVEKKQLARTGTM
jgi:hypothetical protein